MPWKEVNVVNQRTEFALRAVQEVGSFVDLCREFGISRRTGYKWKQRFIGEGVSGMGNQSRRPDSSPKEVKESMVCQIVKLRMAHPTWGASKLRAVLARTAPPNEVPSESSFKRILDKAGLVEHRRRRRTTEGGRVQTPVCAERPNHVWTIDFKGWWYTTNHRRFEPLTIRDDFSRYLLCAHALESSRTEAVRRQMIGVFERYGLPDVIRSDNGSPFAAANSPLGLSRLSAWWLSLGIDLDRIRPGRPDQNGGHERMHRDMAFEVERKVDQDMHTQQASLDVWRQTFNEERPHAAIQMRVPKDVYHTSPRRFDPKPVELVYPPGYLMRKVGAKGEVKIHNVRVGISVALCGLEVGLEPLPEDRLAVWYCKLCLGQIHLGVQKFQPVTASLANPEAPQPAKADEPD